MHPKKLTNSPTKILTAKRYQSTSVTKIPTGEADTKATACPKQPN
ncbi:MAG: hypothetical protein AAF611_06445 [Bacteroidota bacterium]